MLDRYWYGDTSRISPEAPVPVVHVKSSRESPGGAANVALNISALGAHSVLLGITGDDAEAVTLQEQLYKHGVECAFQRQKNVPTVTKLRILSRHQQLIRLDFEQDFPSLEPALMEQKAGELLTNADIMVLSDYGKGALRDPQSLIQLARKAGKPVLVDPKGSDFKKYRGATLITPNCKEFEAVAGVCANQNDLVEKGERLRDDLELEALLITRSEAGMTLLRKQHAPLHLPAHAHEVYDVTGAGDTVIGVLAAALAVDGDLVQAVSLANLAAGVAVTKLGAVAIHAAELEAALHSHSRHGVVSAETLLHLVKAAQSNGESVVMTNGCFDLLHAGHVHYLKQARQLGDHLIVAVNDDDSVRRLKGEKRPINPLQQRMEVLAALESVDWVVPFGEDTPENLICSILPDILVKGGDYQVEQIAGHRCVLNGGGRVLILDFVDGYSSSNVIQRIHEL